MTWIPDRENALRREATVTYTVIVERACSHFARRPNLPNCWSSNDRAS
jgi:hypothetical protein